MIRALKTYLEKGKVFYGIEVTGTGDDTELQFLEAEIKRKELVISKQRKVGSIPELTKVTQSSIPLHVVYNVEGVIAKISQPNSTLNDRAAVEQLFPGLNFENFYYQITKLRENLVVSIAKRSAVDALLSQLKDMKFHVVGLSLGISSIAHVYNHIENEAIYTHSEKISFSTTSNTGVSVTKSEDHKSVVYNINGLEIESSFLLPFSGILNFLSPGDTGNSNFGDTILNLRSEFKNQRSFSLVLRSGLVFVLLLLLSNFLIFNSYFNKTEAVRGKLAIDNEARKNLIVVKNRVEEKERKVEAVLSSSNSRTSFYLDRLASSLPQHILLTELQYQPLKKPMQVSKPIELDFDTLLIMGTCSKSEDFSEWIHLLEALDWVNAVETMDYDYENVNSSTFKIRIHVERS
ncbi:MAG: hypothetical protein AB3N18_07365 [Allomuricauda sp.]